MSTTPRSRSSGKRSASVSPSGRSISASQAASSATSARSCSREGSGPVRVGNTRAADPLGHRVEVAPGRVRRARRRATSSPLAVRPRRVGGDRAPAQLHAEPELGGHRARQQRDEVGVARQARVDPRPRPLGDRRAADVLAPLEHEHRAPGAGEIGGGDQRVVAAADDHGVVGDAAEYPSAPRRRAGARRARSPSSGRPGARGGAGCRPPRSRRPGARRGSAPLSVNTRLVSL